MNQFLAFVKKEFMEFSRSGKLIIMVIVFVVFGVMNPAIAKLTPWMMKMAAESMESSGIIITDVPVDAMTSWTQYYKNVPLMMIIVFIMLSGIFTVEYQRGTLINMLTKGLTRYKIVLAKAFMMLLIWTVGYFLCFGITYGYNEFYWDNSIVSDLFFGVMCIYVSGVWVISLITLASTWLNTNTSVMLMTGVIYLAMYMAGMLPKLTKYLPTGLLNSGELLAGSGNVDDYVMMLVVSALLTVINMMLAVFIFNKKVFK